MKRRRPRVGGTKVRDLASIGGMPQATWRCGWVLARNTLVLLLIVLAAALPPAPPASAAEAPVIFRPAPPPAQPHDWKSVLAATDLPEVDRNRMADLLGAAEQYPSMGTAVALVAHMSLMTPSVREQVNKANRLLLPMADLARHELTIQTNLALNGGPDGKALAAVSRAGSSAKRHKEWLSWDGNWEHLPFDTAYFTQEVGSSDDDLTNWASKEAIDKDPAAHERLNGQFAKNKFNALAKEYRDSVRDGLPDNFAAALMSIDFSKASDKMKVGFLSPTQAWRVLPPVMQQDLSAAPNDLAAFVHANLDKYTGLFFEEQLHKWGSDKGVVTEDVTNPAASTIPYADSLTRGKLKVLSGDTPDDPRNLDPFGWASNSYRQSFVTHEGKLKDIGKYTWRILAYWDNAGLELDRALRDTADATGFNQAIDIESTLKLVKTVYKPDSVEALEAAIAANGGVEKTRERLKAFQMRLLVASHRKHVQVIADHLVKVVRDKTIDPSQPLTFDELKRLAGQDANYFSFDRSLDALANAYANMPPDALAAIAGDLTRYIEAREDSDDAEDNIAASNRLALLGVLHQAIDEATASGAALRDRAGAVAALQNFTRTELGKAISKHLAELDAPDLDVYLLDIFAGKHRKKQLALVKETRNFLGIAIPDLAIREVDAQWTAQDAKADMDRILAMGKVLGWGNEKYASRIRDYFNDDPAVSLQVMKLINQIYDPTNARPRHVQYEVDGEQRSTTIHPSRRIDIALNSGQLVLNAGQFAFIGFMKGAEPITTVWSYWGDANSVKDLAQNLYTAWGGGLSDPTKREEIAKAEFAALSGALGLAGYPEKLLSGAWKTRAETYIGSASTLSKVSNTAQGVIKLATNMRFTTDEAVDLAFAGSMDVALAFQPEIAIALALHGIYTSLKDTYESAIANSELADLIARNGDWEFPEKGGKPPTLKGVMVYDRYIKEDAEKRADMCAKRLYARPIAAPQGTVGVEQILRQGDEFDRNNGTVLCQSYSDGTCTVPSEERVFPRKQMLALYKAGGYADSDMAQRANVDAMKGILNTGFWQAVWDRLNGDSNPDNWTNDWLNNHGIFIKTPEDSPDFIADDVRVNPNLASDFYRQRFASGTQQMVGYLVGQYWVRRQYLMECQLLDPIIKEASRRASKEKIKEKAGEDYSKQLTLIDERIKLLDDRIWPLIAPSSQPYDVQKPPREKRRILQDFREATVPARRYLLMRMRADDGKTYEDETRPRPDEPMPDDVKRQVAQALLDVAQMADRFEDTYDTALGVMGETESKAKEGDGHTLSPYDVEFFDPNSFQEAWAGESPWAALLNDTMPTQVLYPGQSITWPGLDRVKQASEDWVKDYRSATRKAYDDMTKVMAGFQSRITPLTSLDQLFNNPLSGLLEAAPGDLALRHPLWPAQLRLALQFKQVERAIARTNRVQQSEVEALLKTFKFYGEGMGVAPTQLWDARTLSDTRYKRNLVLAEKMFDIKLAFTPDVKPTLGEEVLVKAATSIIQDSHITADQIKGWSQKHIWEIVREEDSPEWVGPQPGSSKPDTLACQFRTGEGAFPDKVFAKNSKDKPEQIYAPVSSGKFKLRLTILTSGDVPMSQQEIPIQIEPARLAGEVQAVGLQASNATYSIYLHERFADASKAARVIMPRAGRFEAYLCEFYSFELAKDYDTAPRSKDHGQIDGYFDATAGAGLLGLQQFMSERAEVRYKAKGLFEISKPLVVTIDQPVDIDVAVTDVTRTPIKDAEITVTAGNGRPNVDAALGTREVRGPPPVRINLMPDDVVGAKAKLDTPDGPAEAESNDRYVHRPDAAKPQDTKKAATLEIALPLYETGRLSVTGRFVEGPNPVGGGQIRAAGLTGDQGTIAVRSDGAFDIVNSGKRVLLSKPIVFQALLHDSSPEKWLLRAGDGNFQAPLPQREDGKVDLGDIAVGRAQLRPVKVTVSVTDAAGNGIKTNRVELTLSDQPVPALDEEKFRGDWTISKWDEEATLKARFRLPDDTWVEATHTLKVSDIGDRFDPKDPKPVEIQLPIFLPGSLAFIWQGRIEGETGPVPAVADFVVKVSDPKGEDGAFDSLGRELNYPFDLAVRVGAVIEVAAEASDDRKRYAGTLVAGAPEPGKKEARLGEVVLTARQAVVPDLFGKTQAEALALLEERGLKLVPAKGDAPDSDAKAGRAYSQTPTAGEAGKPALLPIGGEVTVVFYTETKTVAVPAVRGLPFEDAIAALAGAGFVAQKTPLGPAPEGQEPDIVVAQDPKPGDPGVKAGQTVIISYYEPPPPPPPPTVTDQPGVTASNPWAGPWKGTLKMTSINSQIAGLNFVCNDAPSCPANLRAGLEQLLSVKEMAIFVGMPPNLFAFGAGAIEVAMEGIDVSMGFAYDASVKGYRPTMPGLPPQQAAQAEKQSPPLMETSPGVLTGSITYPGESGGKVDVEFRLSADGGQLDMYVRAEAYAKDAKGVAEARGTFTPGTIDFAKVQAELSGRYDKKVQPYLNIVSAKLNQAQ